MKQLLNILFFSLVLQSYSQNFESKLKPSLNELKEFIAIPNDALNSEDIQNNINWLVNRFSQRGFKTSIIKTEGQPLFFAELPKIQGVKTILFYLHFDGQAVDPSKWNQTTTAWPPGSSRCACG